MQQLEEPKQKARQTSAVQPQGLRQEDEERTVRPVSENAGRVANENLTGVARSPPSGFSHTQTGEARHNNVSPQLRLVCLPVDLASQTRHGNRNGHRYNGTQGMGG